MSSVRAQASEDPGADSKVMSFGEAVRSAIMDCVADDPSVYLLGEGVQDPSSMWGTTKGVAAAHGEHRVVEMPIAENGMMGIAIGSAISGQRPVMSLQRVEFALLAFEQIANNAAKTHYVTNGIHKVPLTIRLVVGRGWGQGPAHSQSLEAVFGHFPGLKVLMPALPGDARALTVAAIRDNNPVVVIEHRWLHNATGAVSMAPVTAAPNEIMDGPRVVRPGKDVTVVATSYMTLEAIRAAERLEACGVSVEVVDVRVIRPLNVAPILESVRRTKRLVTVDTGWSTYGVGGEIIARVVTEGWGTLEVPPRRLGLSDHPTPSSRGLVDGYYPDTIKIMETVAVCLDLPKERVSSAIDTVREERASLPIDVPDPYFKGPF